MSNATGSLAGDRARVRALRGPILTLAGVGLIHCLACARPVAAPPAPAVADTAVSCTKWRVEVFNQTDDRVYVYHVWAREDRLGWVDRGQIAQFIVDSTTRPDIRLKLGHSWYPWAQREDVRITVVCSGMPR